MRKYFYSEKYGLQDPLIKGLKAIFKVDYYCISNNYQNYKKIYIRCIYNYLATDVPTQFI